MNQYLLETKKIMDQLIVVGAQISIKEHIEAIFYGLPSYCTPLVTSIILRLDPYSIEDMEALLLVIEARIERGHTTKIGTQAFQT